MSFAWIDWLSGFLLVTALVHLVMSHADVSFPSVFGRNRKGNLIHSVIVACLSVDIYYFTHDFSAILNNGLLLGALDMYLVYLIFGRWFHDRWQQVSHGKGTSLPSSI